VSKFRKKMAEIEAVQFFPAQGIPEGVITSETGVYWWGGRIVRDGYWLVTDNGTKYSMLNTEFHDAYDPAPTWERPSTFRDELERLINRHSMESGSNTPDHILEHYLFDCLTAFDTAVNRRSDWYGRRDRPGASSEAPVGSGVCQKEVK
jgi:hypothetical protein